MSSTNPRRRVLRRPEVEERVGLARSTLYKLIGQKEFPAPLKLSANSVGWLEEDIEQWLASRQRGTRVQA